MRHLGLFEGIGGFSLAASWAGWHTLVMVEWNQYCKAVLKNNFPNATIFGDIHEFDGQPYAGQIDIITGGFPCQPYSHAGLRAGNDDDRALWPQMLRVIREVGPCWVVGENVAGILSMDGGRVLAGILADLENAGYSPETYSIPAIGVGAPHERERIWIVAHRNAGTSAVPIFAPYGRDETQNINASGQNSRHVWAEHWLPTATRLCRVDDGIPTGVDGTGDIPATPSKKRTAAGKGHRIEALGNAIVPEIAYQIFKAINEYEAQQ